MEAGKVLQALGILLAFAGTVLMSLGGITPDVVRRIGSITASWLKGEPRNVFAYAAHRDVFGANDENWLKKMLESCVVELAAWIYTAIVSHCITWVAAAIAAGYVIVAEPTTSAFEGDPFYLKAPVLQSLAFWLACATIVSLVSHVMLTTLMIVELWSERLPEAIDLLIQPLEFVAAPIRWLNGKMTSLVAVATIYMPRTWYRTVKRVYENGASWMLLVGGLFVTSLAMILQLLSLFSD